MDDSSPNLFQDAYTPDEPALTLTRGQRARAKATLRIEQALDRRCADALPQMQNFWQVDHRPAAFANTGVSNADYAPLRATLYPPVQADLADQPADNSSRDRLRLAVHAMNTTLTIAFPPIGVTVMTYTFLRGESMRLTARTMVLLGAVMTLMHSGLHLT